MIEVQHMKQQSTLRNKLNSLYARKIAVICAHVLKLKQSLLSFNIINNKFTDNLNDVLQKLNIFH
jgi:hypothetical protein